MSTEGFSCPLASAPPKTGSRHCPHQGALPNLSWTTLALSRLQLLLREPARTFHSDFFDLFGFLLNPLLPSDFLSCTHEFLQFLNLLFGSKGKTSEKLGEKSPGSRAVGKEAVELRMDTGTALARCVLPAQRSGHTLSQCLLLSPLGKVLTAKTREH